MRKDRLVTSQSTDIFDELDWRGLIAQSTDREALAAAAAEGPLTLYAGFDPRRPACTPDT